jgi:hypothetical protein
MPRLAPPNLINSGGSVAIDSQCRDTGADRHLRVRRRADVFERYDRPLRFGNQARVNGFQCQAETFRGNPSELASGGELFV